MRTGADGSAPSVGAAEGLVAEAMTPGYVRNASIYNHTPKCNQVDSAFDVVAPLHTLLNLDCFGSAPEWIEFIAQTRDSLAESYDVGFTSSGGL